MKKSVPKRTENDFIQSASVTAMMRALLAEDINIKNPDYLAKYFVSSPWNEFLLNSDESKNNLEKRVPGCIYYHFVRTKKFDQALLNWLKNNNNGQIIILGSGFDSRSLRFKEEIRENIIYEFDLKYMLTYKKNIIQDNNLKISDNTKFIDINFHENDLIESFILNKINPNKNTFIIWEGVSYFLEENTVTSILRNMNKFFKKQLDVILDYAYKDYINGNLNYYGAKELATELENIGEPHVFGLDKNKIELFFSELEYIIDENSTAENLEDEFLLNKNLSIMKKIHAFHGIIKIYKRN